MYGVVGAPGGTLAQLADVAVVIERPDRPEDAARGVLPGRGLARARLAPGAGRAPGPLGVARRRPGQDPVSGAARRSSTATASINELVPDPGQRPARVAAARRGRGADPGRCRRAATARRRRLAAGGRLQSARGGQGHWSRSSELHAVQARVLELLAAEGARFDDFRICLHHPGRAWFRSSQGRATAASPPRECCSTRPDELDIDLERSWMIGDTDSDVLAGARGRVPDDPDRAGRQRATSGQRTAASGRGRRLTWRPPRPCFWREEPVN